MMDLPLSLKKTVCPWLESAEEAYVEHLKGGAQIGDMASVRVFRFVFLMRYAFFQSSAARLDATTASEGAYASYRLLMRKPEFASIRTAAGSAAASCQKAGGEAAAEVLPQLRVEVEAAVEATSASAAGNSLHMERALSLKADAIAEASELQRSDLSANVDAASSFLRYLKAHTRRWRFRRLHLCGSLSANATRLPRSPVHNQLFPKVACNCDRHSDSSSTHDCIGKRGTARCAAHYGGGRCPRDWDFGRFDTLLRYREILLKMREAQKLRGVEVRSGRARTCS